MMKLFVRLAVVAALLAAPAFGSLRAWSDRSQARPATLTLEALRESGELRFVARRGTLSYFPHDGEPAGFEEELLSAFAREQGLRLVPRQAGSAAEADRLLRSGSADLAVLSAEKTRRPGLARVGPYVPAGHGGRSVYPPTGAIFVREDGGPFRSVLQAFLARHFAAGDGERSFVRYFVAPRVLGRPEPGRDVGERGRISDYDDLIAHHAAAAGYDWRLIAALIFQESSFDPRAVSPSGAVGLMQILPATAKARAGDLREPGANIRAGIAYLQRLATLFPESEGEDQLAFVLSAYVLGPGHVFDAQSLARDIGLDPDVWWGSVEDALPLLENERFHRGARFGFARGRDAVAYVHRIFRLHHFFRQRVGDRPGRLAAVRRALSGPG